MRRASFADPRPARPHSPPFEQAGDAVRQHADDDDGGEQQPDPADVETVLRAERRVDRAEQGSGDRCSQQSIGAADDDRDERFDDVVGAEEGHNRRRGSEQPPGQTSEGATEREGQGVHPGRVHAQCLGDRRILDGGAGAQPVFCLHEHEVEQREQDDGDDAENDPIP